MQLKVNVCQIGKKLGIYFPTKIRRYLKFKKKENVEITFIKNNKRFISVSRFNNIISVKKSIYSKLNLKNGDRISLDIKKITSLKKPYKIFKQNKIDILTLIPEKTIKGFLILVSEFNKNNEKWLRINCSHDRGSCSQIEIRRFIGINIFGKLLGQLQAEGTKNNLFKLEFSNKSLFEHIDFIKYLIHLGIPKSKILADCDYHLTIREIGREIKKFEKFVGIKISYQKGSTKSLGGFAFHTFVRSVLLTEIMLSSLSILRTRLILKMWDKKLKFFAGGFFSKILNGDGDIEIITKNRNVPQARLKISDGNLSFLKSYKIMMEKYGLVPHINKKRKFVRCYLNYVSAKMLLSIGAFNNNPNEKKLKFFLNSRKVISRTK